MQGTLRMSLVVYIISTLFRQVAMKEIKLQSDSFLDHEKYFAYYRNLSKSLLDQVLV